MREDVTKKGEGDGARFGVVGDADAWINIYAYIYTPPQRRRNVAAPRPLVPVIQDAHECLNTALIRYTPD